jgi:hypothetical protein
MDYKKYQEQLSSDTNLLLLDNDSLKYGFKPLGRAIIKGRKRDTDPIIEKKYANPKDIIKCNICGKEYTRANKYRHDRTKIHQLLLKMGNKLRQYLYED